MKKKTKMFDLSPLAAVVDLAPLFHAPLEVLVVVLLLVELVVREVAFVHRVVLLLFFPPFFCVFVC